MIYIIDDEKELASVLDSLLTEAGYTCQHFYEARAALSAMESTKDKESLPHLILSDVDMPGMTGLELLEQVRDNSRLKHIPFIFLSARNNTTHIMEALALTADDYITKPVDFKTLLARIENRLNYRGDVVQHVQQTGIQEHMENLQKRLHLTFHDISGVIGNIYLLSSVLNGEESTEHLEENSQYVFQMLKDQTEISVNMLHRMMKVIDKQSQQGKTTPQYHVLKDVLAEAHEMAAILFEQKQLHFDMDVLEQPWQIWGSKEQWQSVFYNLINNAAKFTPAGGTVSIHVVQTEPDQICVQVKDTGKGMSKKRVQGLFSSKLEPHADTSGTVGHGVGLLLCHQLIESLGGSIDVESQVGQGTTFSIQARGGLVTKKNDISILQDGDYLIA